MNLTNANVSDVHLLAITNLMRNAWSAEYALRITPLVTNDEELDTAMHWTFPQAYHGTVFMVRAFLAARGLLTADDRAIAQEVDNLIDGGVYPYTLEWRNAVGMNFITCLSFLRSPKECVVRGEKLLKLHGDFVAQLNTIYAWHESQIHDLIGPSAYVNLLYSMPPYLRDGAVGERWIAMLDNKTVTA